MSSENWTLWKMVLFAIIGAVIWSVLYGIPMALALLGGNHE